MINNHHTILNTLYFCKIYADNLLHKSVNEISILTVIKIFWFIWTCIIGYAFLLAGDVNYKSSKIDDLFDSDEERPATGRVIFQNRADTNFVIVIWSNKIKYDRS